MHCLYIRFPLAALFSALLDFVGISFAISRDIASDYFNVFCTGSSLDLGLERSLFIDSLVVGLGIVRNN